MTQERTKIEGETGYLCAAIRAYLKLVQGGHLGTPTLQDLEFCAKLHTLLMERDSE